MCRNNTGITHDINKWNQSGAINNIKAIFRLSRRRVEMRPATSRTSSLTITTGELTHIRSQPEKVNTLKDPNKVLYI